MPSHEKGKSEEFSKTFEEGEKFDPRGKSLWTAKDPGEASAIGRYMALKQMRSIGGRVTQERAREVRDACLGMGKTPPKMPHERALEGRMEKYHKRKAEREQKERTLDFFAEQRQRNDKYMEKVYALSAIGKLSHQ